MYALTTYEPKLFARMRAEDSVMFDEGLMDPGGVRSVTENLSPANFSEYRDAKLLEVLSLHMSAEAFLR